MSIAKKLLAAYTFLIIFGLSITGVFIYSQKEGNTIETSASSQWETVCCNRKGTNPNYPFDYYAAGNDCQVIRYPKQLASDSPNRMPIGPIIPGLNNFCDEVDPARPIAVAWTPVGPACDPNSWFFTSEWSPCSKSCGTGEQTRTRQNNCGTVEVIRQACNTQACPPSNTAPTITQWQMNSAGHTNFDIFNRQAYYVTIGSERVPVLGGNSNVSAQFSDINNNLINATRRLDYVSALFTDPAPVITENTSGIAQGRYDLPLGTATSTGDAVVRFTASDAANAVTNATQNVIIDNTEPTAAFVTAPSEGSTVSGTISITADFQDNIALYRYLVSLYTTEFCNVGPTNHDDQNTPTNGHKNCSIDTTTLADGNYQLIIKAIDKAGNTSGNVVRNIIVRNTVVSDTDLPTSVLRYVGLNSAGYGTGVSNTGSFTNEADAKFEVTATDSTSAISRIDYRCTTDGVFDGSSTIENWTLVPSSSGASPLIVNFDITGLADDSYTCETRATDAASNVEAAPFSNDVVVNLDRALPTIAFTNNTPAANAMLNSDFTIEVNVDGTFADDSRLHSVYFGVFRRGSTTVGQWCHAEVVNETSGIKSCTIDVSAFLLNNGSSLTEGDYDILVSVQDKALNQATLVRPISIDFTVSPVTYEWGFDIPPANYVANSGTGLARHVTCNGYINNTNPYRGLWAIPNDVSGIVGYERDVVYNGSYVGTFTNTTNYTSAFTPQTGTTANGGQGVYYVRIRAIDGAGNKSISDLQWSVKTPDMSWCKMTIDITAPVTVLNAYTPNPTGAGAITFTGNVSDNLTNISNVEYRYSSDGGSTWSAWVNATPNDTFDSTTEGFSFTTPALTAGNYIFQTRGTDVAGNIETITDDASQQTLVIISDTTAPEIQFNGFRDLANGTYSTANPIRSCGSINSTGFIAWEWSLTNTESAPVTYTFRIVSGPTAVGYTTTTTNTYYHGGIPAQGTYTVEVYGTDAAGNVGTPVQCSVTYDSTAPVSVLNAYTPNPSTDNTPTFTGTVTDNLTNITNVEYRYSSDGGSTWSPWTSVTPNDVFDSTNEGFSFTTPALADGSYIFQTRGTDEAGNVETVVNDESQQTLVINTGNLLPPEPVVDIDEAFAKIINGFMCGIGSAVPDDGLRVNVSNWTSGMQIQGRYFINGGSFSSWFNLNAWGSLSISGTNATLTIMNTGNSLPGNAGWEVRVVDGSGNQLGNIDNLSYIITTDLDSLACGGQIGIGFQTAENSPQTGVGQCHVSTADLSQNNGNSSLQILRWTAVDFATSYILSGYSWNGSSWVSSYSNYAIPNVDLDLTTEPGYVIYRAWATNEGRYAYEVSALDENGNVVGLSTAISSASVCTFTVDRTPVVPLATTNQGYVRGTIPFSIQKRVSASGLKFNKVNITELLKNLRARMLTR